MFISFVWGVFVRGVFGKGVFVQGVFVQGVFVRGFMSGGFLSGGFFPDTLLTLQQGQTLAYLDNSLIYYFDEEDILNFFPEFWSIKS